MPEVDAVALVERWAAELAVSPGWLAARRLEGRERLRSLGLPTTAEERWHYTSLKRLWEVGFGVRPQPELDAAALDDLRLPGAAAELVVVNGQLAPELSRLPTEAGLRVGRLSEADEATRALLGAALAVEDGAAALHEALLEDGWWVLAERAASPGPVHLLQILAGEEAVVAGPRHLVVARTGADLQVLHTHASWGAETLDLGACEVVVGPGARVRQQVVVRAGAGRSSLLLRTGARVERDATWHRHTVVLGGAIVRDEVSAGLVAENATCTLDGLFLPGRGEHVDMPTRVEHAAPRCTTRERYKGVVGSGGRGVFDGTVIVREGASGTDAVQSSRNLLLADDADVNAKPRLEIYNDDVKCAHGTTVGQLDLQQLSYLRVRGIPDEQARAMLTHAFVADVCDAAAIDGDRVRALVEARLAALLGEGA